MVPEALYEKEICAFEARKRALSATLASLEINVETTNQLSRLI
jgi:hypothetical protein